MSGYHISTGVFEITSKKLNRWLQRDPTEEDLMAISEMYPGEQIGDMEVAVYLFRKFGYEVVKIGSGYVRVKATPEQVWEALSGKPSDPNIAKWFYENPAPGSVSINGNRRA